MYAILSYFFFPFGVYYYNFLIVIHIFSAITIILRLQFSHYELLGSIAKIDPLKIWRFLPSTSTQRPCGRCYVEASYCHTNMKHSSNHFLLVDFTPSNRDNLYPLNCVLRGRHDFNREISISDQNLFRQDLSRCFYKSGTWWTYFCFRTSSSSFFFSTLPLVDQLVRLIFVGHEHE